MSVRRCCGPTLAALLAALLLPPAPARAAGAATSVQMHFTWGACDQHVHDLPAAGQTEVRQVVSASGLSGNPGSFVLVISFGPSYDGLDSPWLCALSDVAPEAGAPLAGVVPAITGPCATVPGLSAFGQINGCVTPDGCLSTFSVYGSFPDGTDLDPAETYALVEFVYDLEQVGAPDGPCPGGVLPSESCFGLIYASPATGPYDAQPEWLLSWNRADGDADACAGAVPARGTTWGRLKSIYR